MIQLSSRTTEVSFFALVNGKKMLEIVWPRNGSMLKWVDAFNAEYFIVKNWRQNPAVDYLTAECTSFYKVFHVTSGQAALIAGKKIYILTSGDVALLQPGHVISWSSVSGRLNGHFCSVHPKFFKRADHVREMFATFPHAHPSGHVVPLSENQSKDVQHSFEQMHQESIGSLPDKKQAILLHLQMILLKVRRAIRSRNLSVL